MPTKLKRFSVNIPDQILMPLMMDCRKKRRPMAAHIISILQAHYQALRQPVFFGHAPTAGAELRHAPVPVFEAPSRQTLEHPSDQRASQNQGKS